MKYMGSKKYMLKNGLGKMIVENAKSSKRIVDLFCGAGSVSWFAGEKTNLPVLAVDLQLYATLFTGSVIERDFPLDPQSLFDKWVVNIEEEFAQLPIYKKILRLERKKIDFTQKVFKSRELCKHPSSLGPIFNAYGGYYFSPKQALLIDLLLKRLPREKYKKRVCHAALIEAASMCAASPGHTAQPFQPTESASKFLEHAWNLDIIDACRKSLFQLAPLCTKKSGETYTGDAFKVIKELQPTDLVIVDPPYSEVQYSRFYHVLETIARKKHYTVSGVGRYPELTERPQSDFSLKTKSKNAIEKLLKEIALTKATLILTFPAGKCSNGLSGDLVKDIAEKYFSIEKTHVYGMFSTLGGNNGNRAARKESNELILLMRSKFGESVKVSEKNDETLDNSFLNFPSKVKTI